MAYLVVEDFRTGLDARKMRASLPAGALIDLNNAHINRGGEIEKRKAFVLFTNQLANTFGLKVKAGVPYVFGSGTRPAALPGSVGYQQLVPPGGRTILSILDVELFAGKFYVVVEMDDFSVQHYYDGTRVTDANWTFSSARGLTATTYRQKMYTVRDSQLLFSKIGDPGLWGAAHTGSSFIDMSQELPQAFDLIASTVYQDRIAVMAHNATLIWAVDPDPAKNVLVQPLNQVGCLAPRTAIPYAEQDVFFLSDTGVRSLRARDSSNIASVSDVGTPVDPVIVELIKQLTYAQAYYALATIEPQDGRYWLAIDDVIFVFSFFASSKISAWSYYTPGFAPDDMDADHQYLFIRSDNNLYLYGGTDNNTYDSSVVTATLPFLDASRPGTKKKWQGIDASLIGTWAVAVGPDPDLPEVYETVATGLSGVTMPDPHVPFQQETTHLSTKFTSSGSGEAKISSAVLHYEMGDAE